MAVAPFRKSFVEIDEPLADLRRFRVAAVDVQQSLLDLGGRLDGPDDVSRELGRGYRIAFARQVVQKGVPEGWLRQSPLERGARAAPLGEPAEDRLALRAEDELDLAELRRLEAARRLKPRTERQELERRHRLEDGQLGYHHLQDGEDPLEGVLGAVRLVLVAQAHR